MDEKVAQVVALYVSPDKRVDMTSRRRITLVEGKGVLGDRYYRLRGSFSKKNTVDRQITIIEEEALDAAARDYHLTIRAHLTRRNVVTRGIGLNHLVGCYFKLGAATLEGIKLCEPCALLAKRVGTDRAREALIHRGGLRCRIVEGGVVRVGDVVDA
jgi:hypothetical protein